MKNQKYSSRQRGQLLLEMILALAIGMIIATAFVTLGTFSVRNSRFSANQAVATKLAQEVMEAIITIRDQNTVGAILNNGSDDQWSKLYGTAMNCSTPDDPQASCADTDFILQETPCSLGSPTTIAQRCIEKNSSGDVLSAPNDIFTRKVRIMNPPGGGLTVKDVTVFVWWTDPQGLHKSSLSRKISKEKLQSL